MLTRGKIASTVSNISNVTTQPTLINDSINIALDRVYQHFDWPYYMDSKNGVILTADDYSTGLVTVNNGSVTVTGNASTVWTSSMVGRKIRIGSDKPYYRIIAVGGVNSITVDNPYQGTSVVNSSYDIYKDEYRLRPDLDKQKMARQLQNGVPMMDLTPKLLDTMVPTPQNFADPLYISVIGTNLDTYTQGTVTTNGSIITGIGTAWTSVEGLGRMSHIRVGTSTTGAVYTIKSVDSDTQLTVYDTTTNAANSVYEIKLNNIMVQVYFIPNASRILLYRYFRQPEPLINDQDIPDMPYEFHWLLIYGALSFIYLQKGDINKAQQEAETRFINGLDMMKLKLGNFAADRVIRRKSIDGLRQRRWDGVENSSYDFRYSAY